MSTKKITVTEEELINNFLGSCQQGNKVVFPSVKLGHYEGTIVGIGINTRYEVDEKGKPILDKTGKPVIVPIPETLQKLGEKGVYYKKEEPGKNNNYIRLDIRLNNGQLTNKNLFPEQEQINTDILLGKMETTKSSSVLATLITAMKTAMKLDVYVWRNNNYKNVDFYNAEEALKRKAEEIADAEATANAFLNGVA